MALRPDKTEILDLTSIGIILSRQRTAKVIIRLRGYGIFS